MTGRLDTIVIWTVLGGLGAPLAFQATRGVIRVQRMHRHRRAAERWRPPYSGNGRRGA
jgi:hypothetical protein